MKKLFVSYLLITVCILISLPAYASVGHQETVQMWHTVVSKVKPYRLQLQTLYAEAEVNFGHDKSRLSTAFRKLLAKKFPGSTFSGYSGILKVNNYTSIHFDKQWGIVTLSQDFDGLVKHYNFREKSLNISNGPNRIKIKLDLKTPENSSFISAVIPAINASVIDVWAQKGNGLVAVSPFAEILNDAYEYRIGSVDGMRMDSLAEELLYDALRRQYVLNTATSLYAKNAISTRQVTATSPSIKHQLNANSVFEGLFKSFKKFILPIFAIFAVLGVLKVLALNRIRKRAKNIIRNVIDDVDAFYESRNTLHTPAEQAFHSSLQEVVDSEHYQINGKTRLADLIQVRGSQVTSGWQSAFNRIKSKHVDFVIMEKVSSRILGVIELDDSSHDRPDRIKRDQFVDNVLRQAGIPILHVPWQREYQLQELEESLVEVLGMTAREFGLSSPLRTDF